VAVADPSSSSLALGSTGAAEEPMAADFQRFASAAPRGRAMGMTASAVGDGDDEAGDGLMGPSC
jgi:hypothetical protein